MSNSKRALGNIAKGNEHVLGNLPLDRIATIGNKGSFVLWENKKSVTFDGVDESVSCGDISGFNKDDSFSISLWVKHNNTGVSEHFIAKRDGLTPFKGYGIQKDFADRIVILIANSIINRIKVRGQTALSINTWYNIVFTYDGSSDASGVTIYLNGVAETPTVSSDTLTLDITNSADLSIGSIEGLLAFHKGNIDEVGIWNKKLSQAEVTAIYHLGKPNDLSEHTAYADLDHWWRMGDGDVWPTIKDNRQSDNGAMINMAPGNIVNDTP